MTGSTINIKNTSPSLTEINIEGTIGAPEDWQFENDDNRIATYERFRHEIKKIEDISSAEIVVNIRSTGGNVNDALLIYDTLCSLNSIITTRCYGYTASAATIIAQAASPGRREISASALYLIHKSLCSSEGNARDISQTVELLEKTDRRIASIYASRSDKPTEEFLELMECNNGNGRWLSPEETMEAALVDKIIPSQEKSKENRTASKILQKQKAMTLKQHWSAIMEIMGLNEEKTKTLSADNHLREDENLKRITELQNQVQSLETENARLNALQTKTEAVEDPSPTEVKLSQNALSYEEDIRSFIQK